MNRRNLLLFVVFVAGIASLGVELTASRLVGPFFGTSVLIWAILIGMTLICLTIGYRVGGLFADRSPHEATFYQLTALAAFFVGLIPFIARPILLFSLAGFNAYGDGYNAGIVLSSLIGVNLVFAAPLVLLGMVSPFATRLVVGPVPNAGAKVGTIYALSTLGSIIGNYGTAFWLHARVGTNSTFLIAAALLLLVALIAYTRNALRWLVFVAGIATLALQLTASRLMGPAFGTSIEIWTISIGTTLICLTIGYEVGGRYADRSPRQRTLAALVFIASVLIALIPFIAQPILALFSSAQFGAFAGAFLTFVVLFAAPITLLGMLTPFAVRLTVAEAQNAGSQAGTLYAISTVGSILGAFVPVLVLVPRIGSSTTFLIFAFALLIASLIGLRRTAPQRVPLYGVLTAMLLLMALLVPSGLVKPREELGKTTIYETESAYNYIRVMQIRDFTILELNEGQAIHSLYNPNNLLTGGVWDYFLLAPYFANNIKPTDIKSMALIGSAAGTIAKQYTQVYGPVQIDGVEIDPKIIEVGQQYFAMTDPNFKVYAQDGRYFLRNSPRTYDLVFVDAYRPPYIPFHLTTREFFVQIKDHLNDNGVLAINAGHTLSDYGLVNVLAATMKDVFPNVYVLDVPTRGSTVGNSLVIATKAQTKFDNFRANLRGITQPVLQQVAASAFETNIREVSDSVVEGQRVVFTDNLAPVEEVVHRILINFILTGQ